MSTDQENGKSEGGAAPNSEGLKRRDLLLSGSSLVAASALLGAGVTNSGASAATDIAAQRPANRRTSSSSWATISAGGISAPTTAA